MTHFYVDDSVHDQAGFILGACICTKIDIEQAVTDIITWHGFDPSVFEFKSSTNYSKEPAKAEVRSSMKELMYKHAKLGVVIVPRGRRREFGEECLKAVKQFIDQNTTLTAPFGVHFDQGMFPSIDNAMEIVKKMNFENCEFAFEVDSKNTRGIQLADLAAHIAAIHLKDKMGLIDKMVKARENSGYASDLEINLGFEMWATLRYSFFSKNNKKSVVSTVHDPVFDVEPYGLYISTYCDQELIKSAKAAFSTVYLGCIH